MQTKPTSGVGRQANGNLPNAVTPDCPDASEELFTKAFWLSPDCMIISRLSDRTVIRANEALCRLWGSTPEQIIGRPGQDYATWMNEAERLDFLRQLQEQGECHNHETTLRLTDGRRLDFNISCRLITFKGEACVLSILRDITDHRRGELAAAQLAAIVQSSEDAIIGKNLEGVVTSWNSGAEKIFGYAAVEMVGQPIVRLIPPDRLPEEVEILRRIRRGENIRHLETLRVRKDGQLIDVSITTSAIRDSLGKIIGASKVARDITERKKTERAIRENEERMRLATEATGVGIWEWNVLTNQIRWDAQMFRIYGVPPTKDGFVEYATWSTAVLPEDLSAQEESLQNTARHGGRGSREFRIRRGGDGECRHIQAVETVRANPQGQTEWVVGTNLDITERKQMEAERERLVRLIEHSADFIAVADLEGRIIFMNNGARRMIGLRAGQDAHALHFTDYVPPEWQDFFRDTVIATARSQGIWEGEMQLRNLQTDARVDVARTTFLLRDEAGQPNCFATVTRDITGRKRAEAQIHRLNSELEQRVIERTAQLAAANQELEAFSYSVSHDLRAPLRAMNGFAGIVLEEFGPQLNADGRRYLERIHNGGQRMGELIDDLLAFSRLNRQPLHRERVDTAQLVQAVRNDAAPEQAARPIQWQIGLLPMCDGDTALLKQVWVNLISNAIKYTRGRQPAIIEIGCEPQGGADVFFVRDNGTGFDMQYAHKLFGVFQRLHRADEFEGTGVGLAIVQRVIHRHGGRVWAEAAEGRGATFYFTLQGAQKNERIQ